MQEKNNDTGELTMATILGLDLGSNSIGWAFVDTTNSNITAALPQE